MRSPKRSRSPFKTAATSSSSVGISASRVMSGYASVWPRLQERRGGSAVPPFEPAAEEEEGGAEGRHRDLGADGAVDETDQQRGADDHQGEELERPAKTGEHAQGPASGLLLGLRLRPVRPGGDQPVGAAGEEGQEVLLD